METIAVYWESRIKTYGFHHRADLVLIEAAVIENDMYRFGNRLTVLGENGITFQFVLMQVSNDNEPRLFLLVEERFLDAAVAILTENSNNKNDASLVKVTPVGSVCFHGPHFGERFGIATAVFNLLAGRKIRIMLSGCSASSIYLVLARDQLTDAVACLAEALEVPTKTVRKRK